MKTALLALVLAISAAALPAIAATKDDAAWIKRCMNDNRGEGAKMSVVQKYCECMNEEMDDNETLSISAWEKKNPKIRDACSKKAGWK